VTNPFLLERGLVMKWLDIVLIIHMVVLRGWAGWDSWKRDDWTWAD
jgi:hypothetical protein